MGKINNRHLGMEKEEIAASYLKARGLQMMERNFHCRMGEIDLIGYDGIYLVFVEVKFRSSLKFSNPLSAVDRHKREKICKVADFYRWLRKVPSDFPIRYDVVGILQNEIVWIKNAFPHIYRGK